MLPPFKIDFPFSRDQGTRFTDLLNYACLQTLPTDGL